MNLRLQIATFGTEQNLELIEVKRKKPTFGEVEIKVEASSLSFTDTLLRRGIYPGMKKEFPLTLGYDFIGRVETLGDGVTEWQIGDRVGALTIKGANSKFVVHSSKDLFPVPDAVKAEEAESLILSWITAYQMMFREADVKANDTILIHGAAGGVGNAIVRLAQYYSINVVATAKTNDHEGLKKLGVKNCFDYNDTTLWQKLNSVGGYDAIFDGVSENNFKKSYKLLKSDGTLVCFGFSAKVKNVEKITPKITLLSLLMILKTLFFVFTHKKAKFYDIKRTKVAQPYWFKEDITVLLDLLNTKKIKTQVETIPFTDLKSIRANHKKLTTGGVKGRISIIHNQ
ncbi:zinc-binding dehydrogenase [Flavobacterium sp.]|jgi:NADPH:quinone reductase-like Zn-dependent oxidoreductase|uniref:alcohol dehydrogenase catalytic domain-containing protein n=1 Tax=Flavobacterium sp. TaxID=239 RepID=UPI0022BAC136|nr:zinc-binding dehydrogenase [Flavobacterium sp.]MCZ8091248.1 zinc-binding dehydrogenase [Flavobacterium sp.]